MGLLNSKAASRPTSKAVTHTALTQSRSHLKKRKHRTNFSESRKKQIIMARTGSLSSHSLKKPVLLVDIKFVGLLQCKVQEVLTATEKTFRPVFVMEDSSDEEKNFAQEAANDGVQIEFVEHGFVRQQFIVHKSLELISEDAGCL
jgi:hypothetical protein